MQGELDVRYHSRFSLWQRWKERRRGVSQNSEERAREKELEQWTDLIDRREMDAIRLKTATRYTYALEGSTFADYYTLSYKIDGPKILFIDKDRENGQGERSAVVLTDNKVYYLETVNTLDSSINRRPHQWKVIDDLEMRKGKLRERYESFKKVPLHNGERCAWRGFYPNREEVLECIPLLRK